MANAGTFVKGQKRPNQGNRGPNKSTVKARDAIAAFVDGNADRLQGWLDQIAAEDGAAQAFKAFTDLLEFHVPKLQRRELAGSVEVEVVSKDQRDAAYRAGTNADA